MILRLHLEVVHISLQTKVISSLPSADLCLSEIYGPVVNSSCLSKRNSLKFMTLVHFISPQSLKL
jgi:hypothetical protein